MKLPIGVLTTHCLLSGVSVTWPDQKLSRRSQLSIRVGSAQPDLDHDSRATVSERGGCVGHERVAADRDHTPARPRVRVRNVGASA